MAPFFLSGASQFFIDKKLERADLVKLAKENIRAPI